MTSALFFAGTKSPLTTNQQTSSSGWVLPVSTTRKKNQMETATNYGSWPRQRPRRRGDQSNRERLDDDAPWAAVSRSRGRSAPCPRRWVICSHTMLLQLFSRGPSWRAIPVRGREQDSKRAYLCSLLFHQAQKFKENCRSVAT